MLVLITPNFAQLTYLGRVTFPERHVGISTVADLSLLKDLLDLRHRGGGQTQTQTANASSSDVAIYLNDQVDIWRGVGDGKDGRPGQSGGVHVRGVRFQEIFKLFRVEIVVKVLRYLRAGGKRSKDRHLFEYCPAKCCEHS